MNSIKGSQWRKWDLQVHTPYSKLNNGFGDPEKVETWDEYAKVLFKKAIENNVAVIGICDYFLVDGYKRLINDYYYNTDKLKSLSFSDEQIAQIQDILLLPNIEFRLKRFVGKGANRVNLHVIFSNEVPVSDIEEHFLHDLEFVSERDPDNNDVKPKLKKDNIIGLGARLLQEHEKFKADGDSLFVGMKNAAVDDDQISEQLQGRPDLFKGKYLILVPTDEDLSDISWDGQDHVIRKSIFQKCNIIISGNAKTKDWALGLTYERISDFIKEFKSLKPCITTSDAHDLSALFTITGNKYTWIKADPTFEGLKQLLYEPDSRVKLQAIEPNNKETYQIIDKVRFLDKSDKKLFSNDYIELNPDLNSIIGGRASGKSLLLYYLAKTINKDEVSLRSQENNIRHYDFEEKYNLDFEVVWKDGTINKLSEQSVEDIFNDNEDFSPKRILYIPQNYLSLLAESEKTKDDSELNKFILNVVRNYPALSSQYEEQKLNIAAQNNKVSNILSDLLTARSEALQIHEDIQKIGDPESIKSYINEIQGKLKEIKIISGLTEEQIIKYKELNEEKNLIVQEVRKINEDKKNLKLNLNSALQGLNEYISSLDDSSKSFNNSITREFFENLFEDLTKLKAELVSTQQEKINSLLDTELTKFNTKFAEIENEIKPLEEKIKLRKELNDLTQIYEKENNKISMVETLIKQREQKKEKYLSLKEELITSYKFLIEQYKSLCEILKGAETLMQELVIDVEVKVNNTLFNEKCIDECFNKKEINKIAGREEDSNLYYEAKDIDSHVEFLLTLFNKTLSGVRPIKNHSIEEALNCLFNDFYFIKFGVKYQGDSITHMSPGKRALVILKLLIHFSDDRYPILLDQPDDDLDNRSIYNDLVSFMKQKKVSRQIILVSHNANMVIGSDSEEVLVANQKGQGDQIGNETYRFEYISGAIEQTFTKLDTPLTLKSKGIREHALELLEGSQEAFIKREKKYDLHNRRASVV